MPKIKRALVSVSNKKGLAEFAKSLHSLDYFRENFYVTTSGMFGMQAFL